MNINSLQRINFAELPNRRAERIVGELIAANVPEGTFSSVMVQTLNHSFFGQEQPLKARKITLRRSTLSVGRETAKAFFLQQFNTEAASQRYRDTPRIVNANLVADYLLGDPQLDEEEEKRAVSDLKAIFARGIKLEIYISEDCNSVQVEASTDKKAITIARNAAIGIRSILKNL